jgi:2-polyprenyl-3-methyl-5-hydroxy-6-metoxy-1,4-benzoquinol methylase
MSNLGHIEKLGYDEKRAEKFSENLLAVINNGALCLMLSIGHRAGLFDAMENLAPTTLEEIANRADLNERYVKEWLGAMVTGKVVEYDETNKTYFLPKEHAAFLTRSAVPNNIAQVAQFIPILGQVEDEVLECFRNGGGVPYSSYPRFHEAMAEESAQTVLHALVDSILPLAGGIMEKLDEGIEVLDVGCGSGRAINLMAKTFPNSNFTGYDFSEEGIGNARREAEKMGLKNVRFEVKDAATLNEIEKYDLITAFDAIHDQAQPALVLKGIAECLKPEGTFLMQDIGGSSHVHLNMEHPLGPFTYTISCLHCMTVSLANDGAGLGAMWGEEKACEMLDEAGFKRVTVQRLDHDIQNNYYVAKKQ